MEILGQWNMTNLLRNAEGIDLAPERLQATELEMEQPVLNKTQMMQL